MSKRVGILTGGGDCPGLNAAIRAVTRKCIKDYDYEVFGFLEGWKGLIYDKKIPLTFDTISGILQKGGTILKSSRVNPYREENGVENVLKTLQVNKIDALITIGGEDTQGVSYRLFKEFEAPVIGIPKTIDNDLFSTDFTFGFDTAVSICTEAIDRLHSTAESHDRVLVLEVMGRHAGWIATYSGIAGGADFILIPEKPFDIDEICEAIQNRHKRGRDFSIIVVAEGTTPKEKPGHFVVQTHEKDPFGHVRLGGIGEKIAKEIERKTRFETRAITLGHIQRGGTPTAYDRVLATRFGIKAAELAHNNSFGRMVAIQGNRIISVYLEEAVAKLKTLDMELYDIAEVFFG